MKKAEPVVLTVALAETGNSSPSSVGGISLPRCRNSFFAAIAAEANNETAETIEAFMMSDRNYRL